MSIGEKRRAAPKIPTPAVLSRFLVASGDRQLARREATGMSMPCPYVRLPRFSPFHRAVTIFGRQRRQARPIRRPSLNIAPFRFVVGDAFRLNTHPLRAVTIFAVASHAKIPSTPHNRPRASAPAAPNKKGEYEIRPYEIANCILQ